MMAEYLDLPNIEAAVNAILKADGIRAFSSIPGDAADLDPDVDEAAQPHAYPLAVTARLGGAGGERHALDGARVQVDAWGTNKATALDLIGRVWRLLHEAEPSKIELTDGEVVWISGVDDETKPQWLPDPRTTRDRYIASFAIYARQLEPATS